MLGSGSAGRAAGDEPLPYCWGCLSGCSTRTTTAAGSVSRMGSAPPASRFDGCHVDDGVDGEGEGDGSVERGRPAPEPLDGDPAAHDGDGEPREARDERPEQAPG